VCTLKRKADHLHARAEPRKPRTAPQKSPQNQLAQRRLLGDDAAQSIRREHRHPP
jgi:hypothetical protein